MFSIGRLLHLIGKPGDAPDGVERELIAIEVVQHHHVKERRGGGFIAEAVATLVAA